MEIVIKIPKLFPKMRVEKADGKYYPSVKRNGGWEYLSNSGSWWLIHLGGKDTLDEAIEKAHCYRS